MRSDVLRKLEPTASWDSIDTDEGFRRSSRIWKSLAFRFKAGPLVTEINERITSETSTKHYDLVWIDKGVYLWPKTIGHLRERADCLVHFTPDTAFHANQSRHFSATASEYDLLVTTKSFELEKYHQLVGASQVLLVTQGYDSDLHRAPIQPLQRETVAVFIGLCEPDREQCIETLLSAGVSVRLGGRGWGRFVKRHSFSPNLNYLGKDIFGDRYVHEYTTASIGLGLLSKRFPELHTTRTFEIPACGAMLATERTADTIRFFNEDEVLFFESYEELADKLSMLLSNPEEIEQIASKGCKRVMSDGYDYKSVLSGVLGRLANVG